MKSLLGFLKVKAVVCLCVRTKEGVNWPSLAKTERSCHEREDRLAMEMLKEKTAEQFTYF